MDLAAEETEASSRETILRNIREGALSSAVETVAVCRRKGGSSEAAKAACLTAAKEKLEEHKGVFGDAVTAPEAKIGILAAARRKPSSSGNLALRKVPQRKFAGRSLRMPWKKSTTMLRRMMWKQKSTYSWRKGKASCSLHLACIGSDCFAKFKATFEKDDDSEAASAAAEESAKNAAEFIAACMKDESVSDKSSCRLQAIERFKERVPDNDAFETPAIFEKISEAAANSASDQFAECVKLGEDKAACMQKAAVTLRKKSGVEIESTAVASSSEKEFLRSATRRAAARIYDFAVAIRN